MEKEFKAKKVVKMECIENTADDRVMFEAGKVYDLPVDHPCLEYFRPVTYTDNAADLGPAGVVLVKKGGDDVDK